MQDRDPITLDCLENKSADILEVLQNILEVLQSIFPQKLSSEGIAIHPWEIGASYFIRTVTHHYTGRLVAVYPAELMLTDAAWIAEDGRFAEAVASGVFSEVEPYPDGDTVIIGRDAIIDATVVLWPLPRTQK